MWTIILSIIGSLFPFLGKWLPSAERELGRQEIENEEKQAVLKGVKDAQNIEDANSKLSDADIDKQLRSTSSRSE